jgi:serine phosphatase RsbU (regulator of sigma subunit)
MSLIYRYLIILSFFLLLFIPAAQFLSAQQIVILPKDKQDDVDRYLELVARYKQANNTQQAIFYLNKIAFTYWENGALREAVNFFIESIPLNEKAGNLNDLKAIYSNVGLIYTDLERFDLALDYFYKSLETRRKINSKSDISAGLIDVAYIHGALNQFEKAIPLLEESLGLARDLGNPRLMMNCLRLLSAYYDRIGNLAKAQEANRQFSQLEQQLAKQDVREQYEEIVGKTQAQVERERFEKLAKELELEKQRLFAKSVQDSLGFVVQAKQDSLMRAEQENQQRQLEIEVLTKDKALTDAIVVQQELRQKAQQNIIFFGSIAIALTAVMLFIAYKGYRDKRKANLLLSKQNSEIQEQRDHIQRQNENISKSINYAQGIQKSMLPAQKGLQQYFPESFILFKPRDVVSGDYYWFKPLIDENQPFNPSKDRFIISAIDCTGHGVPGAFLSMIGYNLLDDITQRGIFKPGLILKELNAGIRKALRQDETDNRDGMDMALCLFDPQRRVMEFSGAKNPMIYISNGEAVRVRGDKESIGGGNVDPSYEYTTQEIPIEGPTWFYLFSDGFIDQFGGKDGRKFMIKNFSDLLQHIHELPACEQREILKITFNEWKRKDYAQVDDVLVIGFFVDI